jgi:hypothetical protein
MKERSDPETQFQKANLGHAPLFRLWGNEDQVLYVNRIGKLCPGHPSTSKGTLTNVVNLLGAQKKVLLYHSPKKHFFTVRTTVDLHHVLDASGIKNVEGFLASLQRKEAESDHPEFAFRL